MEGEGEEARLPGAVDGKRGEADPSKWADMVA
jgi:hypothetical protein